MLSEATSSQPTRGSSSVGIDQLPIEMLLKIFNYVSLTDLIKNCVLVSKKWYSLVDEKRLDELIINYGRLSSNHWYQSYRPINLRNLIFCSTPDFIKSPSFIRNFNLKYLKIHLNFEHFEISKLNRLGELEHLEIDNYLNLHEDSVLCLNRLRVLHLQLVGSRLRIDAANLQSFYCSDLTKVQLDRKQSIQQVEVPLFDDSVNELVNLEVLKLTDFDVIRDRNTMRTFLSGLPKNLKKLHFYDPNANGNARGWKNFFAFTRERSLEFSVYLNGIPSDDWLDERLLEHCDLTRLIVEKLDRFDAPLHWFNEFDYDKLLHICTIRSDFFGSFNNLQVIRAGRIAGQVAFGNFLKGCRNLSVLFLTYPSLWSRFYDQLPVSNPLISRFTLFEDEHVVLDYRFVLQFKLLIEFSTTHHLPMSLTADAMRTSPLIERFHHKNHGLKVTILKLGDRYCIEHGATYLADRQLDEITAYCAERRSE